MLAAAPRVEVGMTHVARAAFRPYKNWRRIIVLMVMVIGYGNRYSAFPWIRGATHNGLAILISRISSGTVGRPPRGRDFQRQYDLNPARCQRTMVSGFTIANASQT